jgi:hypothetical protein
MELDAFDEMLAMAQAHDGAGAIFFGGPGADFEICGEIFFFDNQRVVARSGHGHGQALEDGSVVVHDGAGFAVHEMRGANYVSAEGFADGLMSEADTEYGNLSAEVADERDADAGFVRRAGPGRDHDSFRLQGFDFLHRDLIVAAHFDGGTQFSDVLDQVVSEGIVVVEYEDHVGRPLTASYSILPIQLTYSAYTGAADFKLQKSKCRIRISSACRAS